LKTYSYKTAASATAADFIGRTVFISRCGASLRWPGLRFSEGKFSTAARLTALLESCGRKIVLIAVILSIVCLDCIRAQLDNERVQKTYF